jgi:hypothetical protein
MTSPEISTLADLDQLCSGLRDQDAKSIDRARIALILMAVQAQPNTLLWLLEAIRERYTGSDIV